MASRRPAPRTKGRTILTHAFVWAFVAFFPYFLVLTTAAFADAGEGFANWFVGSLVYLAGSVIVAAALCTLELGMLFLFDRSGAMGHKARAAIPGVIIFML